VAGARTATNVVVQKYFPWQLGLTRARELRAPAHRPRGRHHHRWVCRTGTSRPGFADNYRAELKHLLSSRRVLQLACLVSTWVSRQSHSAQPAINSVEDTMESILGLAKTEGMPVQVRLGHRYESSPIRSSRNYSTAAARRRPGQLHEGLDAFAGVIKSGGQDPTRGQDGDSNIDHPDIEESSAARPRKRRRRDAHRCGLRCSFDGEAYKSVFSKTPNNSVRVTDDSWRPYRKTASGPRGRAGGRT